MSKTKLKYEIFMTLFRLLIFALFVFLLCLMFKSTTLGVSDNVFIKDLIENWEKSAIKEIYPEQGNCKEEFLQRLWEGTTPGCDCRGSVHYGLKSEISTNDCTFMQVVLGCKQIQGLEPVNTHVWKGTKLCVRRHEYNFFDSMTITGDKCPKRYSLCGVDTRGFNLCFPKKYGCPVNSIKVSNHPSSSGGYESIKLNDDWYLHYSNGYKNSSIITNIKYSEGRVCINPSETNLKSYMKFKKGHMNFSNSTCFTKIGKFQFDERYKVFDSVSKFKFYTDNKILREVEKLPQVNFQDLINYNSYIYSRSYIHWSPYCRENKELSPESFIGDLLSLIVIDSYLEFSQYIFLIAFFVFTIGLIVCNSININEKYINFYDSLVLVLILTFLPMIGLVAFILSRHSLVINKFVSQKCGDYITNSSFNEIGKNLSEMIINTYQTILWLIILISALIIQKIIKK
jgi:hypothetical protein